jgi:hypothetical protein
MDAIRKIEKPTADPVRGVACIAYIKGSVHGLNLALHPLAAQSHLTLVCPGSMWRNWLEVFLKYIDSHPGELSNMAADVVWRAMIASYPCPAK